MNNVISIDIPMTFKKRGGRKVIVLPDGSLGHPKSAATIDNTMVKALARAFRWQKMLEGGQYATIKEIAKAEKINASYVSRVLRLTLLAPATVQAILDRRAAEAPTLAEAMGVFPVEWIRQTGNHRPPTPDFWETPSSKRRRSCGSKHHC